MSEPVFCAGYHEDRAAFLEEVERFRSRTGRALERHDFVVDSAADLRVSVAEFRAARPERLYLATCGIHGVEGYAGAAIIRELLRSVLPRLAAETTGIVLVHALNPHGFFHGIRVNRHNVDLNRNCAGHADAMFGSLSPEFAALRAVLCPTRPFRPSLRERLRFYAGIGQALARSGTRALRQATLAGQYQDPRGIFYGGAAVQPEIAFFQALYDRWAQAYPELLLTDLHTGYGVRGSAYPLFGQADSSEFRAYTQSGIKDRGGTDKAYVVHGDLVGYSYRTAKRLRPAGTFNGVVVEIGTHGLSIPDQLADLYTVVSENQLRQHGSADTASAEAVRAQFRALFCPEEPAWRKRAVTVGVETVQRLLLQRSYL